MGPVSHELQSSLTSPQQKSSTPWCLGEVSGVFLYNQKEKSLISDSGLPSNATKNPNGLVHPCINVYQTSDYHTCSWSSNKQKSRSLLFISSLFRHLIGLVSISVYLSTFLLFLLPAPSAPQSHSPSLNRQTPGTLQDWEGCTLSLTPLRAKQY